VNHRTVIQWAIVVVIVVTVLWSIVNVHDYAAKFHNGLVVWTLGLSVGTANALSVYAFVIARTRNVKVAAGVGIALFGVMSGLLQMFLYIENGAPLLAAIAFGWFGPVAEAVLSWLHAALSEEGTQGRKQVASKQVQAGASVKQPVKQEQVKLQEIVKQTDKEIAELVNVSRQSVNQWRGAGKLESKLLERLPELQVTVNGKEHS
jgi:hypothetical protein